MEKLIIHPRGEDGHKVFSIRMKKEVVEKLDSIAAKTDRSRNEIIGILLNFALEHYAEEDLEEE